MKKLRINRIINKLLNNFIIYLKTRKNISIFWNFGSLLAFIFIIQRISGLLIILSFDNRINSFYSIEFLIFEFNFGWFFRIIHMNFVSFFFIILILHFIKGIFYFSYNLKEVWFIGVLILLFLIGESFLGYVLIWSQISFWACTVITRLLNVIPIFGEILLLWVWRNFFISALTLKFFFLLHFILPLILLVFIVLHLLFLHNYFRKRKILINRDFEKILFFPFYWIKDAYNLFFLFSFLLFIIKFPFYFNDSEIFLESNRIVSPVHIVPEWYFLFAYDILRRIRNKSLGVFILLFSILIFLFFSFLNQNFYDIFNKIFSFWFLFNLLLLRFLGSCLVENPFISIGIIISIIYFKFIIIFILIKNF